MGTCASAVELQRSVVVAVEDQRFRERLALALSRRGIPAQPFARVERAWFTELTELPAAAIVDCSSPSAVVRKLAGCLPELPILVLTGYASSTRVLPLLALGNVRVRQKPLDTDEMLRALGQVPVQRAADDPEQMLIRPRAYGGGFQ